MILLTPIDPVAIHIGPLAVRWYGLMYAFGFAAAWLLGRWRAKRQAWRGWEPREVDDLVTWLVAGLVLGGRLGYCLFYDPIAYLKDPLEIFAVWHGGMSFHGGAIGVALTAWWFARRTGRTLLQVGDFLVPLAPPGLFFGRIGNFINAELWGKPTTLPWGMVFPDQHSGFVARHPSQLYEAALEGLALFAILWAFSHRPRPTGAVSGLFLLGYGAFRFVVEFARQPDAQLGYLAFGWLTMGQVLSLPMILGGAGLMLWAYRRGDGRGERRD